MAVQGPPLRALPVFPCLHEGCGGRPCPITGSGHQDPQLSRRLAHFGPVARTVVQSQGPGALAPQPVGASGQLGKEQALPCAENLFSRCGVKLGEYDGTSHERVRPISAGLPEFLQRQDSGSTEIVSETPGAYGICSRSLIWARVPLEQVSRHVVVTTDAYSMGWGATCNGQAASGV